MACLDAACVISKEATEGITFEPEEKHTLELKSKPEKRVECNSVPLGLPNVNKLAKFVLEEKPAAWVVFDKLFKYAFSLLVCTQAKKKLFDAKK